MKKIIAMLLMAAMLLGLLSGCSEEKSTAKTTSPVQGELGLQANLTFACPANEDVQAALKEHIAIFQTKFPGVQVELLTELDLSAETLPSIMCITPDQAAPLVAEGKLISMNSWINETGMSQDAEGNLEPVGIDEAAMTPTEELFYGEGKQFEEKATYLMPFYRETLLTFYNATYFEENEISAPYTWEALEQACAKIKETNPEVTPLVCNDVMGMFLSMCAAEGTVYTAEDGLQAVLQSEAALDGLTMLNRWYNLGYITTNTILGEYGTVSTDNGYYVAIDSSAAADRHCPVASGDSYSFELGVAGTLRYEEGSLAAAVQGAGLAMARSDDDDQLMAAWLLVRYLSRNVDFQVALAMAGSYMPVVESVWVEATYSDFLDKADGGENVKALAALFCMEQQHTLFTVPANADNHEIMDTLVNSCMTAPEGDAAKIEEAIQAAVDACE